MVRTKYQQALPAKAMEKRWALILHDIPMNRRCLLGKYCWDGASWEQPEIRTFRTRKEARNAKRECCFSSIAKVVRVNVLIIEES